jgi:DNA-binding transcriptional LysR family regulator
MSRIPIQLLQSFVVFGESKSLVEAAKKLGLSQPGLSKQLKQLEELLPAEAFTMNGRKKALTSFGADLHRRLAARMDGLGEIVSQTAARHASPAGASVRLVGRRGVLDRVSKVQFPGSLVLSELGNEGAIDALLGLRAELGILHALPDTHELVAKPLFREDFRLCLPKKLFPKRPELTRGLLEKLKGARCLAYKSDDPVISALYSSFSLASSDARIFRATESYAALAEMTRAGLGWAILPAYLAEGETAYWALPLPARGLPPREFFLVYRAEMAEALWFKDLLKELKACF